MTNLKHQTDDQLVETLRNEVKARQTKENKIGSLELEQRQLARTIGKYRDEINNSHTRTKWAMYYLLGDKGPL